jgi:UTP:GlnB (protein PII) uridylyltransferase
LPGALGRGSVARLQGTMARRPTPEFITAFVESLPRAYADKYDSDVILAHASVSASRDAEPLKVGLFGRAGDGLAIVAHDRPGLLALISGSLVVCRLDVNHAEVYTRKTADGSKEAVDLFWVRKLDALPGVALEEADARRVEETLGRLLRGEENPRTAVDRQIAAEADKTPGKSADATVRFVADEAGGLATLEVETTDRSGLLFSLSTALFEQRVQIVESEVRTVEHRVFDRFRLMEFDGTPINSARRLEIQVAVLSAIEPARRSKPPSS